MLMNSSEVYAKSIFRWIHRKGCSKTTKLLSFVDKKLYSGLFLKRISEKLVDKESKVVRDRQDDNVLRDLLHCLHGYLTFCGQVYSFNSLLYPDMPKKGIVFCSYFGKIKP